MSSMNKKRISCAEKDNPPLKKKRNMAGYLRCERWEGRYRPHSKVEISIDHPEIRRAFRGFKNGVYQYEFLGYFKTKELKNEWLHEKRSLFSSMQKNETTSKGGNTDVIARRDVNNKNHTQDLPVPICTWVCDHCHAENKNMTKRSSEQRKQIVADGEIGKEIKEQAPISSDALIEERNIFWHIEDDVDKNKLSHVHISQTKSLGGEFISDCYFEGYDDSDFGVIDQWTEDALNVVSGRDSNCCLGSLDICTESVLSCFNMAAVHNTKSHSR